MLEKLHTLIALRLKIMKDIFNENNGGIDDDAEIHSANGQKIGVFTL